MANLWITHNPNKIIGANVECGILVRPLNKRKFDGVSRYTTDKWQLSIGVKFQRGRTSRETEEVREAKNQRPAKRCRKPDKRRRQKSRKERERTRNGRCRRQRERRAAGAGDRRR